MSEIKKDRQKTSSEVKNLKKEHNNSETISADLIVKRDNRLVLAKSNASLFERKLISLALSRLRVTPKGELVSELYAYEIRQQLGIAGGSLYDKLREVSIQSVQRYVFLDDSRGGQTKSAMSDDGHFEVVGMVSKATYRDGKFSLVFNPDLKPLVANIKGPFTSIPFKLLKNFKHLISLRTFEILQVEAYKIRDGRPVEITYGLGELKFLLGVVPLDRKTEVQLRNGMSYDAILDAMDKAPYKDFRNLRKALNMAVKEIEECTDLRVSFEGRRSGIGGRIVAVTFYISRDKTAGEDEMDVSAIDEKDILYLLEYSEGNLTKQDVILLLEKANVSRIQEVYDAAKKQKTVVKNLMGWLVSALDNGWDVSEKETGPAKKKSSSSKKKSGKAGNFYNFEQRQYNWGDLERQLLERSVVPDSVEEALAEEEDLRSFDIASESEKNVVEEGPKELQRDDGLQDLSDISLDDLDDDLKKLIIDRLGRKKRNSRK